MKSAFRIGVIVGLMLIIGLQLFNNSRETQGILDRAERELEAIPVTVYEAHKKSPQIHVKAAGRVSSESEVIVVSQVDGKILSLPVRPGRTVSRGSVLARVDGFYNQQELQIARKTYEQLQADLDRYSGLSSENAISGQQMEQLTLQLEGARTKVEILERRVSDASIKAPIKGTVNQIFVKAGQSVGAGTPIAEIVNKDLVNIKSSLFRDDIELVETGMEFRIKGSFGILPATLSSKGVKPDRTGKYPIEISPESGAEWLKPGMVVNLEGTVSLDTVLLIPEQALVINNNSTGLYIDDNGIARYREIVTGVFYNREVEILQGLNDGDRIIIDGNRFLNDGDKITTVE